MRLMCMGLLIKLLDHHGRHYVSMFDKVFFRIKKNVWNPRFGTPTLF